MHVNGVTRAVIECLAQLMFMMLGDEGNDRRPCPADAHDAGVTRAVMEGLAG